MFLLFLFVCLCFVIGGLVTIWGLLTKSNRPFIKAGVIIGLTPIALILGLAGVESLITTASSLPASTKVEGVYRITKVKGLKLDPGILKKSELILKKDSTFSLTPVPNIEVCKIGKFEVDYKEIDNNISFQCGMGYSVACIERWNDEIRIEFKIGDPDSDQSIIFSKKVE